MIRIRLDEQHFRALVRGEVVRWLTGDEAPADVEIILADIGWAKMLIAIDEAMPDTMRAKAFREDD